MGRLAGVGRRRIDRILIVVKFDWKSALGPQRRLVSLRRACGFSRRNGNGANDEDDEDDDAVEEQQQQQLR